MKDFKYINKSMIRTDGLAKVTGAAEYGADIRREGQLYLKGVYTPVVRGRIVSIDASEALAMPGVVKVLTADDIPGENAFGIIVPDQPVISKGEVFSYADVVAVVAAESPFIAEKAAAAVKVTVEEIAPVLAPSTEEKDELKGDFYPQNITSSYHLQKGDADLGLKASDVTVEATYDTQRIEHSYIEPEAMFTEMEGERLIVRGSTQLPYDLQEVLCSVLALPHEKISVRRSVLGGSFGGKIETTFAMAARAAVVTLATGRPASYVLTREDSFRESMKRHAYRIHTTLGSDKEGHLQGIKQDAVMDGGAYMSLTPAIAWKSTVLGCGPYRTDNAFYETTSYMTDNVSCCSMRGFGTPQAIYAMESAMNELAYKLDISPYRLRWINLLHTGDVAPGGEKLAEHVSLEELLDYVAQEIDFDAKWSRYKDQGNARIRRGVGIACTMRGTSGAQIKDRSQAILYFDGENRLHISLGLVDMGQGLNTAMVMIAGELMGLAPADIIFDEPDTAKELETGSTTGSRGTFMGGNALAAAADNLKKMICSLIGEVYGEKADVKKTVWKDGKVMTGENAYAICELAEEAKKRGTELRAVGVCDLEKPDWDFDKGSGKPFHVYTYSAQAAEVEVDTLTGETKVLRIVAAHDAGRIVNPDMAKGQVQGGILQSLGQALMENFKVDPDTGIPLTKDFTNYMLPTAMDLPEITVHFAEHDEVMGPFGAKSIAEPSIELGAASVSAAVNMALGMEHPLRKLPASPEAILMHRKEFE